MALPPPLAFTGPPPPPPPGPAPNARCDFAAWALRHPPLGIANPSTWVPPQCSPFPPVLHETCKKPLPAMWQPAMNPMPQPHTVCQACYNLHHTSLESNYIAPARRRLRRVSPPVGWNNPSGDGNIPPVPFARFLTRLCDPCERVELDKITFQINQVPSLVPPVDVALADKMRDYPRWQCTCYLEVGWGGIGGPGWFVPPPPLATGGPGWVRNWPKRICKLDHILTHMNMNATRVTNDNWLRNIARNGSGQVVTASIATKRRRDMIGSYRACRCGATVQMIRNPPELLMCLCCEGMIMLPQANVPGSNYQTGLLAPQFGGVRRSTRVAGGNPNPGTSNRGRGNMALGRPVRAGTA